MSRQLKKFLILPVALFCAALLCGCYTQMMSYQTAASGKSSGGGDCGECEDVAPNVNRREVCVWERDILGFPELRCYNTNYHSSWVYFHNTPWWYRNAYGWHDSRGCPPYYYYDRIAGICRHHTNGGGGGGGGGSGSPPPPRPVNSRVIPSAAAPYDGLSPDMPVFKGSTKQLSPVGSPQPPTPSQPQSPGQPLSKPQDGGASNQTSAGDQGHGSESSQGSVSRPVNSRVAPSSSGDEARPQKSRPAEEHNEDSRPNPSNRQRRGM